MAGLRIHKNDTVVVLSGKYKGKTGKVLQAFPKDSTLLVEGINIVKKHKRAGKKGDEGGIIELTKPIAAHKVMLVDPVTNKPSRVGMKVVKGQKKVRISKRTGEEI